MAERFARRGRRRHFYAVVIALRFSVQVSRVDGFQAAPFEQLEIAVSLTPADYGIAVRFVYFVQEKGVVGEKDLDLCVRFSELLFEPCFLGGFLLRIAAADSLSARAQSGRRRNAL